MANRPSANAPPEAEVFETAPQQFANNGGNKPKPSNVPKFLQMLGVIGIESGFGFTTGLMLGRKNVGGVIGSIIALSIVFGLEFWLRYNKSMKGWLLMAGIVALIIAGIVPYMAMSKGGKAKAKDETAYLPTVAGAWSFVAIIFGLVCAQMSDGSVAKADALQGIILSLLYAGVTSTMGYGVGTGAGKSVATKLSGAAWGALVLFDMAGLARAPTAANTAAEPRLGA